MGFLDRFRPKNQFELPPDEETEPVPPAPESANETEDQPRSPEWQAFTETHEFANPLVAEEEAELGAAAEAEPEGFLIDLKKKFGKYRAFLEVSRIVIGVLSGAHSTEAGSTTEDEVMSSGNIVYEQMAEQGEAAIASEAAHEESEKHHTELSDLIEKHPYQAFETLGSWQNEPFAGDLLDQAVRSAPDVVADHLPQLQESPHFQEVIDGLIDRHPVSIVGVMERDPGHGDFLRPALEGSHSQYAGEFIKVIDGGMSAPEIHKAVTILPVIERDHLSPEAVGELVHDKHALTEARIDSFTLGNEGTRDGALRGLAADFGSRISDMNGLKGHDGRFAYADASSPRELYGMLADAGDEARPTTAKGVIDRMFVKMLKEEVSPKELVDSADGMEYKEFASILSASDRLDDFVGHAETPEEHRELISALVDGLDTNPNIDDISAVARTALNEGDSDIGKEIRDAIAHKYEEAVNNHDARGQTVYGHLSGLYGAEAGKWLGDQAENYELQVHEGLPLSELVNADGEHDEIYHFYNDPDGTHSFNKFIKGYVHDGWSVTDHDTYVEVKKTEDGHAIRILANKPEFATRGETDRMEKWDGRSGIADIHAELEAEHKVAQMEVHRGHAYWAPDTVEALSPGTKLYVDGGCFGAGRVESALQAVPDAQLIFTDVKGAGMADINDVMLERIQQSVFHGEDLNWGDIHHDMTERLTGNEDIEKELGYYRLPHMKESAGYLVSLAIQSELESGDLSVN